MPGASERGVRGLGYRPARAGCFGASLRTLVAVAPLSLVSCGEGGAPSGGAAAGGGAGATGAAGAGTGTGGGVAGASGVAQAGGSSGTSAVVAGTGGVAGAPPAGGGSAGASAGGGAGDAVGATIPTISGLLVESNPNSTISCFVSWTTDVPASSAVEFGVGGFQFRIAHPELVTAHRVLVIGMHAATSYDIRAVSTSAAGAAQALGSFETGALPDGLPVAELATIDSTATEGGWTLMNISHADRPAPVIVMYDEGGTPVWYFIDGTTSDSLGDIDTRLLKNGHVLVSAVSTAPAVEVDLASNVVWQGPPQPGMQSANMSHHLDKLENGNYLGLRSVRSTEYDLTGTVVEEFTPAHDVVWSWNIFDHLVPEEMASADWCHGNSVTVDVPGDVLYLSCRNMGLVIKAQRSGDQAVQWTLGEGGSFTFDPPDSGFADLHDPEIHADGTIVIYDNGGYTNNPGPDDRSRVVEYRLDETLMTATRVWEFPGTFVVDPWYTDEWYTPIWGDADRLPNGNILVTAGTREDGEQTRVFEVRRTDGAIVHELRLPLRDGSGYGAYRAERLNPPPLVEKL